MSSKLNAVLDTTLAILSRSTHGMSSVMQSYEDTLATQYEVIAQQESQLQQVTDALRVARQDLQNIQKSSETKKKALYAWHSSDLHAGKAANLKLSKLQREYTDLQALHEATVLGMTQMVSSSTVRPISYKASMSAADPGSANQSTYSYVNATVDMDTPMVAPLSEYNDHATSSGEQNSVSTESVCFVSEIRDGSAAADNSVATSSSDARGDCTIRDVGKISPPTHEYMSNTTTGSTDDVDDTNHSILAPEACDTTNRSVAETSTHGESAGLVKHHSERTDFSPVTDITSTGTTLAQYGEIARERRQAVPTLRLGCLLAQYIVRARFAKVVEDPEGKNLDDDDDVTFRRRNKFKRPTPEELLTRLSALGSTHVVRWKQRMLRLDTVARDLQVL